MSPEGDAPPIANPLPDVRTARLDLRRFAPDDLDELTAFCAQEEVWRFPYGRGLTRIETEQFLDRQIVGWNEHRFGCWVARTLDDGCLIGYVGLNVPTFLPEILPAAEVGWRFSPSAWGKGFATEGATEALDQAFTTLGLKTVCSVPQEGNPASARVADRLGMTLVRTVHIPADEMRGDVTGLLYEVDRGTWMRSRPVAAR